MSVEYGSFKILKYLDRLASLRDGEIFAPVTAEIHLTNACDAKCWFCTDEEQRRLNPGNMSEELVDRLLVELAAMGTESVVWEGGGEPTLAKTFVPSVRRAASLGLRAGLITNGYGILDTETRRAIAESVSWCRVSLNAGNAIDFAREMGLPPARFLSTLEAVAKLRAANRDLVIGYSFVVTDDNIAGIPDAARLAREYGFTYVQYKCLAMPDGTFHVPPSVQALVAEARALAGDVKVYESRLDGHSPSFSTCNAHKFVAHIRADGRVYTCCTLAVHAATSARSGVDFHLPEERYVVGSLVNSSFKEVWNSQRRASLCDSWNVPGATSRCPSCRFADHNAVAESVLNGSRFSSFL